MSTNKKIGLNGIRKFLESLFEEDVHAMRVLSMANATLGVQGYGVRPALLYIMQLNRFDLMLVGIFCR